MKRTDIARLLPDIFQRTLREGEPLLALLEVMEGLHAPSEAALEELPALFHPLRAPERFVPFLARWVDLGVPVTTGLGRQRELVSAAAELSRWRGTVHGMLLFLRTATGRQDFVIDEQVPGKDGRPRPFHIRVRAPAELEPLRAQIDAGLEFVRLGRRAIADGRLGYVVLVARAAPGALRP